MLLLLQRRGSRFSVGLSGHLGTQNGLRHEIAGSERDPGPVSDAPRAFISYLGGHNEGYDDSFKQRFKAFYDYITNADFSFVSIHLLIALAASILALASR